MSVGLDVAQPLLAGMSWMNPDWLLHTFGEPLFWLTLVIIFIECGLFFPFLPGDTLLLALGIFIASSKIDLWPGPPGVEVVIAMLFFVAAAFAGNISGYEIGRKIGPKLYERDGRFLKKEHLDTTHDFFQKHGNKALVIGRFVAFVRTYITLVAGITGMDRRRFYVWSFVGAVAWVLVVTLIGFFVGARWPWLADNIDYLMLALIVLSVAPAIVGWFRRRDAKPEHGGGSGKAEEPRRDRVGSRSED